MSRWKRHSDDGLRRPRAAPSASTATRSSASVSSYGSALGVTRKPPSMRALTLPDLPRLMPSAFICRAVRTTASRRARVSRGGIGALLEQRAQGTRIGRDAALGDVAGDQPLRRDVEREVERARVRRRDADVDDLAAFAAAANAQHLVGGRSEEHT